MFDIYSRHSKVLTWTAWYAMFDIYSRHSKVLTWTAWSAMFDIQQAQTAWTVIFLTNKEYFTSVLFS
jgi:hypothetical protein